MDLGDKNLQPIRVLGEGTFGRVFLCKSRCDGVKERKFCVKRIIVQNPKVELGMIKEEVYIISQLRHPHIVQFIRTFEHASTVNIVMEYAPNGTIRDVINRSANSGSLTKKDILRYFSEMLMGLEYLHIRHVMHRDIKPENMLLDINDRVKIADFGISTVHAPCKQYYHNMGTPLYMAPEVLRGEKFCFKSDIWSLGCVLYEMCMLRNPFAPLAVGLHTTEQLHNVVRALTRRRKLDCQAIKCRYGAVFSGICEVMIYYDPQCRVSLPELLCLDPTLTLNYYQRYFKYDY